MREWVLVVMGVSIIAVFAQILLQNGKTANTVKKSVTVLLTAVIITPLPTLIKNGFNFNQDLFDFSFESDLTFTEYTDNYLVNCLISDLKYAVKSAGEGDIDATIDFVRIDDEIKINAVYVIFKGEVILDEQEHINKCNRVKAIILKNISVDEEKIIFNERSN